MTDDNDDGDRELLRRTSLRRSATLAPSSRRTISLLTLLCAVTGLGLATYTPRLAPNHASVRITSLHRSSSAQC